MPSHRSPAADAQHQAAIPQIQVVSPPRTTKTRREPRDTGFPEPFDEGRNMMLSHPEADLSPNATISCEDVAADRALKRHRLSFLHKNKKTLNHGVISPQMEALQSVLSLPLMDADMGAKEPAKLTRPSTSSLRRSGDGGESVGSKSSRKGDDDTPPTSPDELEHRRKKGLFGRLRREG